MTTYKTGNPVGSTDPRDLYDNAENLDELVNSQDKAEHPDRLGVSRKTWHGMESEFNADQADRRAEFNTDQTSREAVFSDFLQASGYQDLGEYAPGIEITAHNQYVTFDGQPYLLKPSIPVPYTTSGEWTGDDFKLIGDGSLRQDLANPDKGAEMVARAPICVDSIETLKALNPSVGRAVTLTDGHRRGAFVVKSGTPAEDPFEGVFIPLTEGKYAERLGVDKVEFKWFGADPTAGTPSGAEMVAAVNVANALKLPIYGGKGEKYLFDWGKSLNIEVGIYGGMTIYRSSTDLGTLTPLILINSDDAYVKDVNLIYNNDTNSLIGDYVQYGGIGVIEIKGGSNVTVEGVRISGGKFGIWPYGGGNIKIINCDISNATDAGLYLGQNLVPYPNKTGNVISNISVTGCKIYGITSVPVGGNVGDGLKAVGDVLNTRISDNYIHDCNLDALDLYASGHRVIVTNNVLKNCGVNGIDMKGDSDITGASINRDMIISNNLIEGNLGNGVTVTNSSDVPGLSVRSVSVNNNIINGCYEGGVRVEGRNITVSNNIVYGCAQSGVSYLSGIRVSGRFSTNPTERVIVNGNVCYNNGSTSNTNENNGGITVGPYVNNITITNNHCFVDEREANPVQHYGLAVRAAGVTVQGNKLYNNSKYDLHSPSVPECEVLSSIKRIETANTDVVFPSTRRRISPTAISLVSSVPIPASETKYYRFRLVHVDSQGGRTNITTTTNLTEGITAYQSQLCGQNSDSRTLESDGAFVLEVTNLGGADALGEVQFSLHYVDT